MTPHAGADRIEGAIRAATRARRPALAAFLTAGYPTRRDFPELLAHVAREADVIEIGVPFSDPMADGATIQHSSRVALAEGTNVSWILEVVEKARIPRPLVLMSYLNPLLAFGRSPPELPVDDDDRDRIETGIDVTPLARAAARAGISGLIIPDLPLEESAPLREELDRTSLALIQLVSPVTPPDRLARLCEASRGFVYAVTSTGTTGGSLRSGPGTLAYLDRVRACTHLPVLAGFGIRRPEELRDLAPHLDGAIVGSALIEAIEHEGVGEGPAALLRRLREGASIPASPTGAKTRGRTRKETRS